MNSRKLSVIKWTGLILTITIGLLLVACGSDGVTREKATVERVEVKVARGNPPQYAAVVLGYLPDNCTKLGRAQQRVVRQTIMVTLYTRRTDGVTCTPSSVPFRETIRLDVSGLSAGSYAVDVNGAVNTFTLAEDH